MRKINGWLLIGIIGIAVFGSHLAIQYGQAVWGNSDMWWTPRSMALPLSETRQNFELFVRGELLQRHLDRGSLSAIDSQAGRYSFVPEDVEVRLYNWQKVKSSMLHIAVLAAFMLGISVMSLIVGIIQFVAKNKATANKANADNA